MADEYKIKQMCIYMPAEDGSCAGSICSLTGHDISVKSQKTFRMRGAFLKRKIPVCKTIVFSLLKVCLALRSREARRLKENQIAMRAAYLEKQVEFIIVVFVCFGNHLLGAVHK